LQDSVSAKERECKCENAFAPAGATDRKPITTDSGAPTLLPRLKSIISVEYITRDKFVGSSSTERVDHDPERMRSKRKGSFYLE